MVNRWWGPASGYRWEQDALDYLRSKMADYGEPYRAWQTFTFTANNGRVRECDLLIATPAGLHLVEIKSHPGRAANDGPRWLFRGPDRTRTIDNPLSLTDLKAKELKQQLEWARRELGIRGGDLRIPFVQPVVFLSDPSLRCGFDDVQRKNVYGRDEIAEQTTLPGIWRDLLGARPAAPRLDARTSRQLDKLLHKIGLNGLRGPGKVGPLELHDRIDLGPGWEDYLADNPALPGDVPRRVRVYVTSRGTNPEERKQIQRAAHREYLSLLGVTHEGIVRVESYSDELDSGPAIVFRHGADWQRLDHFMTERGAGLPIETRVEMVRQLAEAVDHAHRRNLYHRALSARSVYVEMDGRYPRLRIADWQTAAHRTGTRTSGETTVTDLRSRVESAAQAYLAPEFDTPDADGVQLDLFGLGALTYLLLTGRPPADDRRELAQRMRDDRTLVPSAVVDDMTTNMDDLVRGATHVRPADRFESVREFLDYLELVETELTDPDVEVADPLEAKVGAEIEGWKVEKVLGKGSTARALLLSLNDHHRVLKVALDDDAARRLEHEAAQLEVLNETHDAHIVRLLDGPRRIGGRMVIATEYAGGRTLAQYLRREGPITGVADLENLGEDLLSAIEHLDAVDVRHRDIKPDNLAVKELPKKGRRLMLFDFSLAGAGDQSIGAGTQPYLDPFLGGDRPRFDAAAERYAAAVTLHEMASGETPSWGDNATDPKLLDEDTPQLWADLFDPNLRDGLVAFFRQALHRDAGRRFGTVKQMRHAWTAIFAALDRPAPSPSGEDATDPEQALRDKAARATLDTPLAAAGLPPRALSVAERQLGASTVGDLVDIPAQKVQRLRGVGLGTKNELVRQAREWRRRLRVSERADTGHETVDGTVRPHVDELVGHLLPAAKGNNATEIRVMRIALALPADDGSPAPLRPWATQSEVGKVADGVHQAHVATIWNASRGRWKKLGTLMKDLRDEVVEIIAGHGRVMEAGQIAVELLARRGCGLDDPAVRLAYAQAAVRAAIETEESVTEPRLLKRRRGRGLSSTPDGPGARVLVALCDPSDATAPNERDLLDYAERLGDRADALVAADTLPGGAEVRTALLAIPRDPDGSIAPMPDADLVGLAAAASRTAALTPRLELYPRDLPLPRALRLAQVGALFGPAVVVDPEKVRARVLARFPELTGDAPLADRPRLRALLKDVGIETTYEDGTDHGRTFAGLRLDLPVTSVSYTPLSRSSSVDAWVPGADPSADTGRRLAAAAERGGFLALKVHTDLAPRAAEAVAAQPGVTAVNVTSEFVATLRAVVAERGRPRWETVIAADVPDASPAARVGFGKLVDEVWRRLADRVREAAQQSGTAVFLHDTAPLTRYTGGLDLLARLADAARRPDEAPWGLWVLCPMGHPQNDALLDGEPVGVYGAEEQLDLPRGFAAERRAS